MRVLLLDAEENNINIIKHHLSEHFSDWQFSSCNNSFAFVTSVYDEYLGDVDLLMIHLTAPWHELILMCKELQAFFPHIHIIFYSEDLSCAEDIFDARPVYFLRMPISQQALHKAFERADTEYRKEKGQSFSISYKGRLIRILFSSVRYIESEKRKIILYTDNGPFETYMTMETAKEHLPDFFVRCHRSYLVNMNRVRMYENGSVLLSDGESVPLSRTFQKEIMNHLKERVL